MYNLQNFAEAITILLNIQDITIALNFSYKKNITKYEKHYALISKSTQDYQKKKNLGVNSRIHSMQTLHQLRVICITGGLSSTNGRQIKISISPWNRAI